jgi:hypothetical protein
MKGAAMPEIEAFEIKNIAFTYNETTGSQIEIPSPLSDGNIWYLYQNSDTREFELQINVKEKLYELRCDSFDEAMMIVHLFKSSDDVERFRDKIKN